MAALPLPLQLKSWKGCNAELMAQPTSRVSSVDNRSPRREPKYGTDQPDESTVYSSVYNWHAHRALSLLHLPTSVAVVMQCALAQLDVVECR